MSIYNIGNIIKELRKKKAFSQKQLAEGICSIEYISKIENNKKNPSPDITSKLLLKLGTDPDMFFSHLDYIDNEAYQAHRFKLEALISKSDFGSARQYIRELEKNYSFYASGEPKQYIMGKYSHILCNTGKQFDEAYELAYNAMLITKPDFTIENMDKYEFYSINELWALLYMSTALFWKERDIGLGNNILPSVNIGRIVFSHLEKGYLQPSLIGEIYTATTFYLSKYLYIMDMIDESSFVAEKGINFVTNHYNQIIEMLGKICFNKACCSYSLNKSEESERMHITATLLIELADNKITMHRYLDHKITELLKHYKYPEFEKKEAMKYYSETHKNINNTTSDN